MAGRISFYCLKSLIVRKKWAEKHKHWSENDMSIELSNDEISQYFTKDRAETVRHGNKKQEK